MIQRLDLQLSLLRGATVPRPCLAAGQPSRSREVQLRPQHRASVSDRLAVLLLDLVARGHIPPGTRLPPERQIAESVGVSRVCVRAALERLKTQGYLQSVQGSGTRVVAADDEEDFPLALLLAANTDNLHDLADMRGYLECWAAERAAHFATVEQVESLRELVEEAERPDFPDDAKAENDLHFHQTIARASGSRVYEHLVLLLNRTLRAYFVQVRYTLYTGPERDRELREHHRAIYQAIAAGDPRTARDAMHQHSLAVRAAYRENGEALVSVSQFRNSALTLSAEEVLALLAEARDDLLCDKVAMAILALVTSGRLGPGDKLPGERELADRMDVSRVSVRAALGRLKQAGWLESMPRSGTRVAGKQPPQCPPPSLEALVKASRANLSDLCEIRGYLEVRAAGRAASLATEDQRWELEKIVRDMKRVDRSARFKAHDDLRFHLVIARACGSAVYQYLMDALQDTLADYFEYARNDLAPAPEDDAAALEQHIAIQEAICNRDAAAAIQAMDEHSRYFREVFRRRWPSPGPRS